MYSLKYKSRNFWVDATVHAVEQVNAEIFCLGFTPEAVSEHGNTPQKSSGEGEGGISPD